MQGLSARARSLVRSPDAVFAALWIASLLAGVLVLRDFGLAWDEPLFYRYSDAVGYASCRRLALLALRDSGLSAEQGQHRCGPAP